MVGGALKSIVAPKLNGEGLVVNSLLEDHQKSLWVRAHQGIYRIRGTDVDHYQTMDGLSGELVRAFFEDREGNLWAATSKGIEITYQHSFSGYGSDRRAAELLTVQPLVHYNFNKGFYLRSSGVWNLDYGNHVGEIPIGFGAGKVWTLPGGTVMNCFVEPQYSVYRTGTGAPI
jgi:hypothetical protein